MLYPHHVLKLFQLFVWEQFVNVLILWSVPPTRLCHSSRDGTGRQMDATTNRPIISNTQQTCSQWNDKRFYVFPMLFVVLFVWLCYISSNSVSLSTFALEFNLFVELSMRSIRFPPSPAFIQTMAISNIEQEIHP